MGERTEKDAFSGTGREGRNGCFYAEISTGSFQPWGVDWDGDGNLLAGVWNLPTGYTGDFSDRILLVF